MTVEIRTAVAADESPCFELLATLAGTTGTARPGEEEPIRETFRALLDASRGEILVADEGGVLLGMASVSYNVAMRYGGEYCQLEELIVDPAARGKNLGARLVQTTVDRARARGCPEYGLYLLASTEHNLEFYQKFGFEKVGSELRQRLDCVAISAARG